MRIDRTGYSLGELLSAMGQGKSTASALEASVRSAFKRELQATSEQTSTATETDESDVGMTPFLAAGLNAQSEASNSEQTSQNSVTASTTSTATTEETASTADSTVAVTYSLDTTEPDPSPAAPWNVTLVKPSVASALGPDTKTALNDALTKAGLDPTQVKVSYWEELVWYPGGSYINKSITVQTPNGQKVDFDAAATLRSPYVTAATVQQMMQMPDATTDGMVVS